MGAWSPGTFDNDEACDWGHDLEETADLALVEAALGAVERARGELERELGVEALAACEVLARLQGRHGYRDAYTEAVDAWCAAHAALVVTPALLQRALAVIDRVLGPTSELAALWDEGGDDGGWRASVADLRARVEG